MTLFRRSLILAAAVSALAGCPSRTEAELVVITTGEDGVEVPAHDATVDFDLVPLGATATRQVLLKNLGPDAIEVHLEPTEESEFSTSFEPRSLNAGEAVEVEVTFAPKETHEAEATLTFKAPGVAAEKGTATVSLLARSVQGDCSGIKRIDFGQVGVDEESTQSFSLTNSTSVPQDFVIGEATSGSGAEVAFPFAEGSARGSVTVPPGESAEVKLHFRPTESRDYLAFLKVKPPAGCEEYTVTLAGSGVSPVLTWAPEAVDFGYVPPGLQGTRAIEFSNARSAPVHLTGLQTSQGEFEIVDPPGGTLTLPGAFIDSTGTVVPGKARLELTVIPSGEGPRQTVLKFQTDIARQPQGQAVLKVYGGGPDIEVDPSSSIDFGVAAYFANSATSPAVRRRLVIRNVGTAPTPAANLHVGTKSPTGAIGEPSFEITALGPDTQPGEFVVQLPSSWDPAVGLGATAGKNELLAHVVLNPRSVGIKQAQLRIHSDDLDEPVVTINLTADVQVFPPCDATVSTDALYFGHVVAPRHRDLSVTIHNNGTNPGDVCLLSGVMLNPGAAPDYALIDPPPASLILQPDESRELTVRVRPAAPSQSSTQIVTGALELTLSTPVQSDYSINLGATVGPGCLVITPDADDLGRVQVGCHSATRTFRIYNTCAAAQSVSTLFLAEGGPEFTLSGGAAGLSIPALGSTTFELTYAPTNPGKDTAVVNLDTTENGANLTYIATLTGEGDASTQPIQTDTFARPAQPKADVLIVMENYNFAPANQLNFANEFFAFTQYAQTSNVDWRIAVTTTDVDPAMAGKFVAGAAVGTPEKILTPSTPQVDAKFSANVQVGSGGTGFMVMESALKALSEPLVTTANAGFLRDDAILSVVTVTGKLDASPSTTAYYLDRFFSLKGPWAPNAFGFNAISGFTVACPVDTGELAFFVEQTGGVTGDICAPAPWTTMVKDLGNRAFGQRTRWSLTSVPDLTAGAMAVTLNGANVPDASTGVPGWSYDPIANVITVAPLFAPGSGGTLEVSYPTTCY